MTARTKIPTASDIMQRKLETIPPEAEIETAVRLLLQKGLSGAPVVDADGVLRGVLSEHDCISVLTRAVSEAWPGGKVESHMTSEIDTVSPADDVFAISTRFTQGRHRRLLVVDEGRLVGLISRRDVMRALEAMEQALSRSGGKTTYELIDERHQKLD
jgi:CBS domain-containing protein